MAELPDHDDCVELLGRMCLIRRFEEEAGRQYQRAKAGGFLHLASGEEATIVGTTSVMRDDDYLIGTYRTHGHAIARGTPAKSVMACLLYTSDAADDLLCVDLGGRRSIKKKKKHKKHGMRCSTIPTRLSSIKMDDTI